MEKKRLFSKQIIYYVRLESLLEILKLYLNMTNQIGKKHDCYPEFRFFLLSYSWDFSFGKKEINNNSYYKTHDLTNYPNGLYLLKIKDDKSVKTKKIILNR